MKNNPPADLCVVQLAWISYSFEKFMKIAILWRKRCAVSITKKRVDVTTWSIVPQEAAAKKIILSMIGPKDLYSWLVVWSMTYLVLFSSWANYKSFNVYYAYKLKTLPFDHN